MISKKFFLPRVFSMFIIASFLVATSAQAMQTTDINEKFAQEFLQNVLKGTYDISDKKNWQPNCLLWPVEDQAWSETSNEQPSAPKIAQYLEKIVQEELKKIKNSQKNKTFNPLAFAITRTFHIETKIENKRIKLNLLQEYTAYLKPIFAKLEQETKKLKEQSAYLEQWRLDMQEKGL